jgi:hypothetical protein
MLIVLLTGFIAYANSLRAPFQFDDRVIADKTLLLARLSLSAARQVADFSFLLNHGINGNNVLGFHLLNLLIHLGSALLVYCLAAAVIRALAGAEPDQADDSRFMWQFVPFATALLFVAHPVQTQAVTYIVQRYTSLATFFYLLSMLLFVKARLGRINGAGRAYVRGAGIGALFAGLLAMRCKEIAFTLPLMVILAELCFFKGRLLRSKVFWVGLAALLLIVPAQQLLRHGATGVNDLISGIGRGSREELTYSRMDYLMTQFRVVITYLRLLLYPVNQNLDYDYPLRKSFDLPVVASLSVHLLMLSTAAFLFIKSRAFFKSRSMTSGTCARLCAFGIAWFYVTLLVESSVIPIIDVIFEHRLYLPSTGIFLAATSAAVWLFAGRAMRRKYAWLALGIIVLTLTTATIRRNAVWNDELLLWEDTARKSPHKARVLNNLVTCYLDRHMPQKAIAPLLQALEIRPGFTEGLNNLGALLDQIPEARGRYNNGAKFLTADNRVDLRFINPWVATTRNNLGLVQELQGNNAKALASYESAAALAPANEAVWLNLANMSAQLGNNKRAAEALDQLRQLNPQRAKDVAADIFRK